MTIPSNVALYEFSPRSWRYRTRTFSSFFACRMYSRASGGRSRTGFLKSQPCDAQIASRIFSRHDASLASLAHGTSAPFWRLLLVSGMTSAGSISRRVPRPAQAGHAPCGELNEKLRGSSSSIVNPSYGQVNRSL